MLNGLMAIPNLIGLLGLTGIVVYESKQILAKIKAEKKKSKTAYLFKPNAFDSRPFLLA